MLEVRVMVATGICERVLRMMREIEENVVDDRRYEMLMMRYGREWKV